MNPHAVEVIATPTWNGDVHFRFGLDESPQRTRRRVTEHGPVSAGQQGRGLQSERSRSRMTDEVDVLVDAM